MLSDNDKMILNGFPNDVQDSVSRVLKRISKQDWYQTHELTTFVLNKNTTVTIPGRILVDNYIADRLDGIDGIVYDSVLSRSTKLSRSTNGYVREKAVRGLYNRVQLPFWALPYLFLSMSDYVFNISSVVHPGSRFIYQFCELSKLNPEEYRLLKARASSYWGAYYRYEISKDKYPALLVINEIKSVSLSKLGIKY